MPDTTQLSALQMTLMRVLWQRSEATAAEIHEAVLAERDLAPTTVATVLSRLAKKGVVTYRQEGRQYVYRPLVSEHDVRQSMVGDLVEQLFDGDAAALVSHLLHESEMAPGDLDRLRALLENHSDLASTEPETPDHA